MHLPSPTEIEDAKTPRGGWTRDTLASWGVAWPPPKGWLTDLNTRYRRAHPGWTVPVPVNPPGALVIATDGACFPNPGFGGWAWVVSGTHWAAGGVRTATSNQMELRAALEALLAAPAGSDLVIETDSKYVVGIFTQWLPGWKRNGWMTSAKEPVKNKDLILQIERAQAGRAVSWRWVKGHNGHVLNEIADARANAAATAVQNGRAVVTGPDAADQFLSAVVVEDVPEEGISWLVTIIGVLEEHGCADCLSLVQDLDR